MATLIKVQCPACDQMVAGLVINRRALLDDTTACPVMCPACSLRHDQLFIGVFPTGFSYADRSREEHGDYKQVAFLSYQTLDLEIRDPTSPLLPEVRRHAACIQARRGQQYQVSSSGQTVRLGNG